MTPVNQRKSRLTILSCDEVRYRGKYRRVVVEVHRDGCTADVRLEGMRTRFPVSFGGIYNHAVKIAVEKQRAEKRRK